MSEDKVLEKLKAWINKCRGNIGKEAILDKIAELEDEAEHEEAEAKHKEAEEETNLKAMLNNPILDKNKSILDDDLNLSVRAVWCLKNAGVRTLGDLTSMTEEELVSKGIIGKKSLAEIKEMLAKNGLSFKGAQCEVLYSIRK